MNFRVENINKEIEIIKKNQIVQYSTNSTV